MLLFVLIVICALLYLFTLSVCNDAVYTGNYNNIGIIFILNRIFKWGTIIFGLAFIIKLII